MKMPETMHSFTIIFTTISLLFFLNGCGREKPKQEPDLGRSAKTMIVLEGGGFSWAYPGKVQGVQRVHLSFRVSGPLVALPINEGDAVKEGQLLAQIDPRDYKVKLEEAKAEFKKADADYKRYLELYEDDAVPLADLDFYRAKRDIAKARLENAQDALRDTNLKAPFPGIIGIKFVNNFQYVKAKQDIATLNDLTKIEIVIDVPENMVAEAKEGADLKFAASFEVAPGKKFPLKIKEVRTQADPETQTYKLTLIMPQPKEINILPGMTASVRSYVAYEDLKEKIILIVPSIAVFADDNGASCVWVVSPDDLTVHQRKVKIGAVTGTDSIQILDGLSPNERIVVAGVNELREGMKIRLNYRLMKKQR